MSAARGMLTRSFWYSVGLVVIFNSLFLAYVLIKPGTPEQFTIVDDVGQAIGWFLATLLCFVGIDIPWRRAASRSDATRAAHTVRNLVPLLLALGIFCQFIGQVIYTYYDLHNWSNFPSWADAAYLSTFPFLLTGILLIPTRPLSGFTRVRVTLDGFMIMTALVTFSWYLLLGPTMLHGGETILAKIVGSAYPFFDLVLIFCVLRFSFTASDPALRPASNLLPLGLIMIVIADSIYDYQTLQGTYNSGWQDVGWPIGYMLIALAAQALNLVHSRHSTSSEATPGEVSTHDTTIAISSGWQALLPYALIPAVILLTIYTWRMGADGNLVRGVYLGEIALIGLVLLRQFFAIRETIFYNRELRRVQRELHTKNQALSEANVQLEAQATQIAEAYEQQLHLNELKDQFLLNVNHELRTPLTAIHGYLELLQEYQEQLDTRKQANFINLAVQGCEELQQLVSNVLDTIQGDFQAKVPQFEVISVASVVCEAIDLFEPQKRQEYLINTEIPDTLTVWADRQYLHQILLNLLSNAFKYSPKHTSVAIRAQAYEAAAPEDHISSQVCICVQDAGLGIPPSEIPVLFGKFVRLKRDLVGSVRGTGLGLYICRQLVEAMGGHIWVESSGRAGAGSCFFFTLLSTPGASVVEGPRTSMSVEQNDTLRVLDTAQKE